MPARLPLNLKSAAGWDRLARLAAFAVLIGRFWLPYHGFTALLQADRDTEALLPASLQDTPIFIHPYAGRYDGAYYAQIATSPALKDPQLAVAVDDVGYRARRILLSAIAWVVGGGDPVRAVHAYAWLNVVGWFLLAAVLWLILPADGGWRNPLAWAALLFASGTLASVRLALTDLVALLLLAGGIRSIERGRATVGAACLGLAGLARETAFLGAGALWPGGRPGTALLLRRGLLAVLAALPLVAWWSYVLAAAGSSSAGVGNFMLPLAGWCGKWMELWRLTGVEGNHGLLLGAWLDAVALTVQAVYLLAYRETGNIWWRVGVLFLALGAVLGVSVWEGLLGAYSRVLLPMALAFNVVAVRRRAALPWLLLGNLSVFAGIQALWSPPDTTHRLPAHSTWQSSHLLETDTRWSNTEQHRGSYWAWCRDGAGRGGLTFRLWPHRPKVRLEVALNGITPREVEIWHGGRPVWRGRIGVRNQWVALPELPCERGRIELELRSLAPPVPDGAGEHARMISIACSGARLAE